MRKEKSQLGMTEIPFFSSINHAVAHGDQKSDQRLSEIFEKHTLQFHCSPLGDTDRSLNLI